MSQPVTHVPTENGQTTITTQVGDTVYVLNSRDGTYKHTLHRVRRIAHGLAVTYCTVWARGGTVMPLESDCAVWCEYGCKPKSDKCTECGLMDIGGGHPAHALECSKYS